MDQNAVTLTVTRQHRAAARVQRSAREWARSARKVCTQGLHARSARKVCTQGLHATIAIASHERRRDGSGTTTVAAATALLLAGHAATELVAAERDTTAALFGLRGTHDGYAPIKVAERLTLVSTPSGTAEMAVVDAQRLDQLDRRPGCCSRRCCGARATWACGRSRPVHVARTIDAGLLVSRFYRLPKFNALRRDLNGLATPHDNDTPTPNTTLSHMHTSRPKNGLHERHRLARSAKQRNEPSPRRESSTSSTRRRSLTITDVYGRRRESTRLTSSHPREAARLGSCHTPSSRLRGGSAKQTQHQS